MGDLLYRIELTLTSIEPVTFVLVSAEELLSFSPELFGDNTFYNVFYDGSEDTQSWVVEHLIFDSQGTFTLREQNGVY